MTFVYRLAIQMRLLYAQESAEVCTQGKGFQRMLDICRIAPFFSEWDETLIWSCLQGCMGYAIADDEENPSAAQIVVGDFCFYAGTPDGGLVAKAAAPIITPKDEKWNPFIEAVWGDRVERTCRYAMKKQPDAFDTERLTQYAESLGKEYELKMFDEGVYDLVAWENWSKDFCSQFIDYSDYHKRGLGVAAIYQGKPVSGASSYTVYHGGIEIEIDTKSEFRGKGLATACGARLILECLSRGLYPSWDAHDLRSVALAEKLGYQMDHPYTVYIKK